MPISVDKQPTDSNDEATGEVMLDVEVVAGICPKATIPAWFSRFTEKGWVDALDAAMHHPKYKPQVLSISWGWAENQPDAQAGSYRHQLRFQRAGILRIALELAMEAVRTQ